MTRSCQERAEVKVWAVSAAFLNFHAELHCQDLWLTAALERSTSISTVEGGIAQVTEAAGGHLLCDPAMDPQAGIFMKHEQGTSRCVSSGPHAGLGQPANKDDSVQKFYLLFANIRGQSPMRTDDPDELYLEASHTTYDQLALVTDQELAASYHRLNARRTTCSSKAEFANCQNATGLT